MEKIEKRKQLLTDLDGLSLRVSNGQIFILDQRKLPYDEIWLPVETIRDAYEYIYTLATRGAPMIACVASLALALHSIVVSCDPEDIRRSCEYLKSSRPTAVNLGHACNLIAQVGVSEPDFSPENITKIAYGIIYREIEMCEKMAELGARLINDGDNILTHCNTGSLATMGLGTALGIIKKAYRQGKKIHVYVDETRPLLQGGRLTSYELEKEKIPYTIICDNMAGFLMKQGRIQKIFVGADRIAINGDFANKIGTYSLAVLAKYHNIPFYTVAPWSTVDIFCKSGDNIPIEERNKDEVKGAFGTFWSPKNSNTYNPAFDVTPGHLLTALILDTGIYDYESIKNGCLDLIKKNEH